MRVPLDICTGSYTSESVPFNSQRCINLIPISPQAASLTDKALFGTPGIKAWTTAQGINRGGILAKGIPYKVNGTSLFSFDDVGLATNHGSVFGTGRVSMATNTTVDGVTKIAIVVPGFASYVFDSSLGTVVKITDPDFQVADTVSFKDGYYIFTASNGFQFFVSDLNDPTSFNSLFTGTAEIDPDLIVATIVNHNELFVFGTETGELFQNIGGTGFPFQRIPGANVQKGLHARFGLIAFDNSFVFLGGGKNEKSAIWMISGSSAAVKVSTAAIDHAIQKFTKAEISESFAMTYAKNGNFFAIFTFESNVIASKTFVYNATTSAMAGPTWHELQSGVSDNRSRIQSITQAYGKLLVGDQNTNNIGELDDNTFSEYGDAKIYEKTSQPFRALDQSQFWGELEVLMEQGVGLTTGQGSDPIIQMSFSDDSGRTYKGPFNRRFGKIGEYGRRSTWRRQGRIPTNRRLRLRMSDPVRCNILGAHVKDELGDD